MLQARLVGRKFVLHVSWQIVQVKTLLSIRNREVTRGPSTWAGKIWLRNPVHTKVHLRRRSTARVTALVLQKSKLKSVYASQKVLIKTDIVAICIQICFHD